MTLVLCLRWLLAVAVIGLAATAASAQDLTKSKGKFVGEVVAALADDGRNLVLREPFGFIDSNGMEWGVPAGSETDGASVPKAFWVAYPPFTGKYRRAAVIHDYYCQTRERSWQSTHDVFFDAMLAAGVDNKTAKVMWAAVYYMGPRWDDEDGTRSLFGPKPPGPKDEAGQADALKRLETWIARENPSRDAIEQAMARGSIP